jgi:hypothetical protein
MKFKKVFFQYFIPFIISLILVTLLFKQNNFYATAEEGVPLYDSLRTFNLYKSVWLDIGLGISSPFYIPRLTFYGFTFLLEKMGLEVSVSQSIVFFLLLFVPLISIPKLVNELFPKTNKMVGYISSLFYIFNLFSLSQVFARFIYPLIFLWSYLPLFLYLWIKYLNTKSFKYLLFLCLSSLIFSDVFGLTASVFALWIPAFLFSLYSFFTSENKKKTIFLIFAGFILWCIANIWWIYPLFKLSGGTYSSMLNDNQNINSLVEVSGYYPNKEIFLLKQKYWFGEKISWSNYFKDDRIQRISIAALFAAIVGIIASRKKEKWIFMLSLFFVSWFICKGANPPLGVEFYKFIYKYFPATQTLRNPYEKFGSVFILPYSFFFAWGVYWIGTKIGMFRLIFFAIFLWYTLHLLVKPLWTGEVLSNYSVKIPQYYEDANLYLNKIGEGRLLQLPLLRGSSLSYSWGYTGEEPSEFLFDRPSVSKSFIFNEFEDFYLLFQDNTYFRGNRDFTNILYLMNIEDVVLHKDVIPSAFFQEGVEDSRVNVLNWKDIRFSNTFGNLQIYSLPKEKSLGRVYLSGNLKKVNNLKDVFDEIIKDSFRPGYDAVFSSSQSNVNFSLVNSKIPSFIFDRISSSRYRVKIINSEHPFVLILADNFNSLWQASSDNRELKNHFEVNGFANGWFVEKKGDYTIDIIFKVWPWD